MAKSTRTKTSNALPAKPVLGADRAWQNLESMLAHVLPDLGRDEFLIVSHRTSAVFVQFAGHGRNGMRAEAISNDYLPDGDRLSSAAVRALVRCGWTRPAHDAETEDSTQPEEGFTHFYVDVKRPVSFPLLAAMAVKSLHEVYKVRVPASCSTTHSIRTAPPSGFRR